MTFMQNESNLKESMTYIGKPVRRIDGRAKVTGRALFSDDLPQLRTGYAVVKHAALSHARIVGIDTSKAKALPEVRAVFTAEDIPNNDRYFRMGSTGDTWILAKDYVRHIGDMVAFVVAETEEAAREAVKLIEVTYEPLPVISRLRQAEEAEDLARGDKPGNVAMPLVVTRGDVEKDFEEAGVFAGGRFTYPSLSQLHLEPNSVTAVYEDGRLTVYCASQVWFHLREDISAVTGLPEKQIELRPMCIGGAFGARNDQPLPVIASLLAYLTKSAVRMTNTRLEEFLACRPSVGMEIEMTLAADEAGHFLSKKTKLLSGFGAFSSDADAVTAIACLRADNNYRFRSVYVEGTGLYLNHTPTGAYRGFGNPQMHFALESLIDMLAVKLRMDPTELRLLNHHGPGETSIHGFIYETNGIAACMARAKELMDWDHKKAHPSPGRGVGVASLIHCAGSRAGKPEFAGSSAIVRLDSAGAVTVFAGECEMGQGITTVLAQIVGEELGLDPETVRVVMGDTALTPFSTGSNGSKLTGNLGRSVQLACQDLKRQIREAAAEAETDGPAMSLDEAARFVSLKNNGRPTDGFGRFEPPSELGDRTGYGNLAPAYVFGVQMADVTVKEDGSVIVNKLVSVHDIGRVINSRMALGQVCGGVTQALGASLMEDLSLNEDGVFQANTILEYKPPTILDVPEIEGGFVETLDPYGPYGAKCIAEPPVMAVAPAIANAIYDAAGIRLFDLPITPAKVRLALKERKAEAKERADNG